MEPTVDITKLFEAGSLVTTGRVFCAPIFSDLFGPQAKCVDPSAWRVCNGGEIVAVRAEDRIDLVKGRQEALRLTRRFEPPHDVVAFRVDRCKFSILLFRPLCA